MCGICVIGIIICLCFCCGGVFRGVMMVVLCFFCLFVLLFVDFVFYVGLVDNGIIFFKDGSFMVGWYFVGFDFESVMDFECNDLFC